MTMHALRVVLVLTLSIPALAQAQETLTLETPVFVDPGVTQFRFWSLYVQRAATPEDGPAQIMVVFREVAGATFVPNGRRLTCQYLGDPAETRIRQLNRLDNSVTSLEKTLVQRCQKDGKVGQGIVTGTPESGGGGDDDLWVGLLFAEDTPFAIIGGRLVAPKEKQ